MADSLVTDDMNVAQQNSMHNIIEAKLEGVKKLKDEYSRLLQTNERQNCLLNESVPIDEVETSFSDQLNLLHDTEATLCSEIHAAWQFVDGKREDALRLKSAQLEAQEHRSVEVKSFERILSERLPKFRDALTVYSDDYLTKDIENIRNEGQYVKNKIENVDRNIKAFVSKYDLDEIATVVIPGREASMTKLQELKTIWMNSNLARVSGRKLYEYSNKELEGKIETNKRKLAALA